jgi:hypothetical protein
MFVDCKIHSGFYVSQAASDRHWRPHACMLGEARLCCVIVVNYVIHETREWRCRLARDRACCADWLDEEVPDGSHLVFHEHAPLQRQGRHSEVRQVQLPLLGCTASNLLHFHPRGCQALPMDMVAVTCMLSAVSICDVRAVCRVALRTSSASSLTSVSISTPSARPTWWQSSIASCLCLRTRSGSSSRS